MKNILITGASGNIGYEIIRGLTEIKSGHHIIAAGFNIEKAKNILQDFSSIEHRKLDFADQGTFGEALEGVDLVFLLRPPQLADVPKYFEPFVDAMLARNIRQIVFLSVQGVENQKGIPHHKIEKLILEKDLDYAFLRPSYFMQNLATTLIHEIRTRNTLFIPAGKEKFTWVDARDIGGVGAYILNDFESRQNKAFVITGSEQLNFEEVAELLSSVLGRKIAYESPSLMKFFREKRKLGLQKMMIFVMIMLHYLPRFSKKKSELTQTVQEITGKSPGTLHSFMEREKRRFTPTA